MVCSRLKYIYQRRKVKAEGKAKDKHFNLKHNISIGCMYLSSVN